MSEAFRVNIRKYAINNVCLILINQTRANISADPWDVEVPTYGGMATSYYAAIRMFLTKGKTIKNGKETIGTWLKIKSLKNKVYQPFREVSLPLYYDSGINIDEAIMELCIEQDIIQKVGSHGGWYKLNDDLFEESKDRPNFQRKTFNPILEENKAAIYDALERLCRC